MDSQLNYYISLFDYTYVDLVNYLLNQYGSVLDDYYKEKSYNKYMKGEIKSIQKGEHSRTQDGLFAHHIDGNEHSHLSCAVMLKKNEIPYKHHKKERLVYCDLIEHTILHMLIALESDGRHGIIGTSFLISYIQDWYVFKVNLSVKWAINCKKKSYLTKKEALILLEKFEQIPFVKEEKITRLERLYWDKLYAENTEEYERDFNSKEEFVHYYSQFPLASDETTAEIEKVKEKYEIEMEKDRQKHRKEMEESRRCSYNFAQENIKQGGTISRQTILHNLYVFKYNKKYTDFESFNSAMMPIMKEDLIKEFQLVEYTQHYLL